MPTVLNEYGSPVEVTPDEAAALLQQGYTLESPEQAAVRAERAQYETPGEALITGAEGLASGATLGLSDVALAEALGDEYRTGRERRERLFPTLSTGSEVAGALAPLLLSEGATAPSLIGRGARLLGSPVRGAAALGRGAETLAGGALRGIGLEGKSILGSGVLRGIETGAGGLVEGGLYGAGQALSEAALAPGGNYDKLAEKLWAGAKQGMSLGAIGAGGLGFMAGATARGVERGFSKLSGAKGLQSIVARFADDQTARALGATSADINNLGKTLAQREKGLELMARDIREGTLKDGTRLFKAGDNAEELAERVGKAQKEIGEELGAFRKQVNDFIETTRPDLRTDVRGVVSEIDNISAPLKATGIPELVQRGKKLDRTFASLRKQIQGANNNAVMSLDDLTKWRQNLDNVLFPKRAGGLRSGGLPPPPPVHKAELEQARAVLERKIEDTVERAVKEMPGDQAGRYEFLKGKYRSYKQATQIAEGAANRELGGRAFKLSDYITGAAGVAGTVASGAFGGLVASGGLAIANKLARERGSSVLAVMADRLAKADGRIGSGVRGYFKRASDIRRGLTSGAVGQEVEARSRVDQSLGRKPSEPRVAAYRRKVDEIARFNANPVAGMEARLGTKFPKVAPSTAIAMTTVATRGMQFLQSKVPTPAADPSDPYTHLHPPEPTPTEMAKFSRYVQVVDDPLSVIDELEQGTLAPEHTEALKSVYPGIYEDMQGRVLAEISQAKAPPPVDQRMQLGILLDIPTDKALRPTSILAAQSAYQAQAAPPQPIAQGGSTNFAKGYASRVQAIEGQEMEI